MLKMTDPVNELERRASEALLTLLKQVPAITVEEIEHSLPGPSPNIDVLARISASGEPHVLVCEVKAVGQPRFVRAALLQLHAHVTRLGKNATAVFIAPYLSPDARRLCHEQGVGFLDLEGNARIVFDGVFIERSVSSKPAPDRRTLRSLFKPRSAQILRVMLRKPSRAWRTIELAQAADVSLGHVSNVRTALLDREWAHVASEGLSLTQPDAVLDAWRNAYDASAGRHLSFYTTLHGAAFDEAARRVFATSFDHMDINVAFASFSAASWLAPYGRSGTQYFYANDNGLDRLREILRLSPTTRGENVMAILPNDPGIFRDIVEPAPGILCTGPVQTYLDLAVAGERGREAADHLREERLRWQE